MSNTTCHVTDCDLPIVPPRYCPEHEMKKLIGMPLEEKAMAHVDEPNVISAVPATASENEAIRAKGQWSLQTLTANGVDYLVPPGEESYSNGEWLPMYGSPHAPFILTACNSHADLLSALKALVARAEREMVDPVDVGEVQHAHAVIAKAEAR